MYPKSLFSSKGRVGGASRRFERDLEKDIPTGIISVKIVWEWFTGYKPYTMKEHVWQRT